MQIDRILGKTKKGKDLQNYTLSNFKISHQVDCLFHVRSHQNVFVLTRFNILHVHFMFIHMKYLSPGSDITSNFEE